MKTRLIARARQGQAVLATVAVFALLLLTACGRAGGRRGPALPPIEDWSQVVVLVVLALGLWWGVSKMLRG